MPIYKRIGSPFWWIRLGRKTRRSSGTTDRARAEEFERVLQQRLWRTEKLGDRGALSWKEAAKRWLDSSAKPRTRDREILAWLAPRLDEEQVSAVAHADTLEQLRLDAHADGWSPATTDRMMNTVRAVLCACVRWRHLEMVPPVPMYNAASTEPMWLTPQQFAALLRELPPHLALAAQFAVLTLLRMRSQSYLTWSRIDLKNRRGWVPRASMKGAKTFGFPLSREAIKVLHAVRTLSPTGDRVFQFEGEGIDNFNTKAFRKAAERAGLSGLRWHDLRHTGASWAVQSGVTLPELMALGDWKSYSSVLRYAHFAPSHAANAAERVAHWQHTARRSARAK